MDSAALNEPNLEAIVNLIRQEVIDCQSILQSGGAFDTVVLKLESMIMLLEEDDLAFVTWKNAAIEAAERVIQLLNVEETPYPTLAQGSRKIILPVENIEYLLSLHFKIVDIAKIYKVSRYTISRRLMEYGISARASYANISEEDLGQKIISILHRFPNTGYKRMKGFLLSEGLKVPDKAVRIAMRSVDPLGVYQRTLTNRAIIRRQYNVQYFNEMWHLDTNMKLIRWNIIIRGCIDGKSRLVVYLDASGDNRAATNLVSFVNATSAYGIPYRTRSDKGGENVLIAQFMLEHRGTGRASHICGRSVHNQRIERYWRDVYYGYTSDLVNIFTVLEHNGHLNIDNPKHMFVLHKIYLPRINDSLQRFRDAWNHHPLSSERNRSPIQIMLMSLPPVEHDMELSDMDRTAFSFYCNTFEDIQHIQDSNETVINPLSIHNVLTDSELQRIEQLDLYADSDTFGMNIFLDALRCLETD